MATDTEQLVVTLEARIRDFERNFEKANRTASTNWSAIEKRSATASRRLETMLTASAARIQTAFIGSLGRLGIGVGLTGLSTSIVNVINDVDALVKTARKIGVGFEELQELRYGFDLAGVSINTTDESLAQFSRRIGEAASKGGELADVLAANGVAIRDSEGNIRPVMALLRDYANLISNATSEQEKLQLAQLGFGKGGTDMVLALNDGAASLDNAKAAAQEAGVVLKDDLAPSVEEVNDAFNRLSAQVQTNFKRAVLGVITDARSLGSELYGLGGVLDWVVEKFGHLESAEERALGTLRLRLKLGRFAEEGFSLEDFAGFNPPAAKTPTVIPTKPERPSQTTVRARQERDAIAQLITTLQHELSLISATDVERAIANNLRIAGADATDDQRRQIEALTRALVEGEAASLRAAEAGQFFGTTAVDALDDLLLNARSVNDVVDGLARSLARATLEAALLGSGPLAGLFGGGSSGGLASLFGGFRANGGDVAPGKAYVVGERRPEIFVPNVAGTILPDARALRSSPGGGGTMRVEFNAKIDVSGGGASSKENLDLARKIGAELHPALREMVLGELRGQMQPGGMLNE